MIDHHTAQRRRFIAGNPSLVVRIWRYFTQPRPDVQSRITLAEERTLSRRRREAIKTLGKHWVLAKNSTFGRETSHD